MAKKPSYADTLAYIANAEWGGYELFKKWSAATDDEKLKEVFDVVAVREAEHSLAFEKRLNELGIPLERQKNKALTKLLRVLGSNRSDLEKFEALGVGTDAADAGPDRLMSLLEDKSIDPATGALFGRFICEERDSGRLLLGAYRSLKRRTAKAA